MQGGWMRNRRLMQNILWFDNWLMNLARFSCWSIQSERLSKFFVRSASFFDWSIQSGKWSDWSFQQTRFSRRSTQWEQISDLYRFNPRYCSSDWERCSDRFHQKNCLTVRHIPIPIALRTSLLYTNPLQRESGEDAGAKFGGSEMDARR